MKQEADSNRHRRLVETMRLFRYGCFVVLLSNLTHGAAPLLKPGAVTVGKDLQTFTTVQLTEPASTDTIITLTSSDPARLRLAKLPDEPGTPTISLKIRAGFRESTDYWLQALSDSGEVRYTAAAPGYESGSATVALSPSGVILIGPMGEGAPPEFITTPKAWPTKIAIRMARLDQALKPVETQYVRGGLAVEVAFSPSDPGVGDINPPSVKIAAAEDSARVEFAPKRAGKSTLSLKTSPQFHQPAAMHNVSATVRTPGIALADDMMIGENLQLAAALSLGEPAPAGGLKVTVNSHDASRLLLSSSPTEAGRGSLELTLPAGSVSTTYYLQSLASSGTVSHTATAEGFAARTGTVGLAPSGVILMLEHHGPPDEAEVFRPQTAGSKRNVFVALLSEPPPPLVVYTAFLDPASRRSADITVQPLRAGLTLEVALRNASPDIGQITATPVIRGGQEKAVVPFKPSRPGQTLLSVVTPKGFTEPTNATELLAIVRE
jgi:hypothetical protein